MGRGGVAVRAAAMAVLLAGCTSTASQTTVANSQTSAQTTPAGPQTTPAGPQTSSQTAVVGLPTGSQTTTQTAAQTTPATFDTSPLAWVDLVTGWVDSDRAWRAEHAIASFGGHVFCDVAPYARSDAGSTVYAEVLCQEFVGTAKGVYLVSGSQSFITVHLRMLGGFVVGVGAVESATDATLQAYVAKLPASARAAHWRPHTFVNPADGSGWERAAAESATGTLPMTLTAGPQNPPPGDVRTLQRTKQAPFGTAAFGVTTRWHGMVDGQEILVYVGGPKSEDGGRFVGGGLRIVTDENDLHGVGTPGAPALQTYVDASLAGPLTAIGELAPDLLTLVTADGRTVAFDLVRRRFSTP